MDDPQTFTQRVISNNKEIFEELIKELGTAQSEILVATAWFTDALLLDALIQRASAGVKVDVIIAQNTENEKLDFQLLTAKGASVIRIKNVGYGIMHQKFCIIDRTKALHGSYNWSNNAKANNHESIITTTHKETVEQLVKAFFDIKQRAISILEGNSEFLDTGDIIPPSPTNGAAHAPTKIHDDVAEYRAALESLIATETNTFDRDQLKTAGYERAKENNGDAHVLTNVFDSIYSMFVDGINMGEEKRKRLRIKIEELKANTNGRLNEISRIKVHTLENEIRVAKETTSLKISNEKARMALADQEAAALDERKVPMIDQEILSINSQIAETEQLLVKPGIKWHFAIPVGVFAFALFVYLFIFYSSAAYILLFSEADAKEQRMNGVVVTPPEVFNPRALSMVISKGPTAVVYDFFFVFIPLACACIGLFTSVRWVKYSMIAVGVLAVDFFIAWTVTRTIHDIEYLTGKINTDFSFTGMLADTNFYLVFVLGALGLILFKFAFERLTEIFDARHPDTVRDKNLLKANQLRGRVSQLEEQRREVRERGLALLQSAQLSRSTVEKHEIELVALDARMANAMEANKVDVATKTGSIDRITEINLTYIDNNNIPVQVHSMKDRINVFLEGWNDFLHDEYSVLKASSKSRDATQVAMSWHTAKVQAGLDSRITV